MTQHQCTRRWLTNTHPCIFVLACGWTPVGALKVAYNWSLTVIFLKLIFRAFVKVSVFLSSCELCAHNQSLTTHLCSPTESGNLGRASVPSNLFIGHSHFHRDRNGHDFRAQFQPGWHNFRLCLDGRLRPPKSLHKKGHARPPNSPARFASTTHFLWIIYDDFSLVRYWCPKNSIRVVFYW